MKQNKIIELSPYHSPIGTLLLGSYEQLLCLCLWEESASFEKRLQKMQTLSGASFVHKSSPIIEETKRQLDEYLIKSVPISIFLFTYGVLLFSKRRGMS